METHTALYSKQLFLCVTESNHFSFKKFLIYKLFRHAELVSPAFRNLILADRSYDLIGQMIIRIHLILFF